MADYVLGASLELKDGFSATIATAKKGFQGLSSAVDKYSGNIKSSVVSMGKGFNSISKTAFTGVIAGFGAIATAGAGAATYGIKLSADLEKYRTTLDAVLKDEEKAKQKMTWANDFANVTPFETGQVVESVVKLESYGIDSQSVLGSVGNMAAAMGKPLMQAVEAMADAQTGELERLKEFGITKNMIEEYSKEIGDGDLINAKGQITDIKAFNIVLQRLMDSKFAGAMEKQSKTFYGAWSTTAGVLKSSFAQVMGMAVDGETVAGSAFDFARKKLVGLSEYLMKVQKDGTMEKWTQKIGSAFEDAIPHLENFWNSAKEKFEDGTITGAISSVASAFGKIGDGVVKMSKAVTDFDEKGFSGMMTAFANTDSGMRKVILHWSTLGTAIGAARVAAGDMTALPSLMLSGAVALGAGATFGAEWLEEFQKEATGGYDPSQMTYAEALENDARLRSVGGDKIADEQLERARLNDYLKNESNKVKDGIYNGAKEKPMPSVFNMPEVTINVNSSADEQTKKAENLVNKYIGGLRVELDTLYLSTK